MTPANVAVSTWKAGSPETGSVSSSHCRPGQCLELGVDQGPGHLSGTKLLLWSSLLGP